MRRQARRQAAGAVLEKIQPGTYVINVLRVDSPDYEFYPIDLRSRLPRVGIPLKPDEPDVVLDLQAALARVYEAGAYHVRIDYNREPPTHLDARRSKLGQTESARPPREPVGNH